MTPEFKVGDRVRLKPGHRHDRLLPGDTGTVVVVLPPSVEGEKPHYRVRMNRTTAGMNATLNADEVEPMP
jgi:hypothetical protein